jgi:hypothetical protein
VQQTRPPSLTSANKKDLHQYVRLIGLLHPHNKSHASLAGQVLFLAYIEIQVNGLRITYFASTNASIVPRVQTTKQTPSHSQRTR